MAPKRLKNYTAAFKLAVMERAAEIGNRAAAKEYEVDEKCVRRWKKDKEKLLQMPRSKRADRGGIVKFPKLEEELSSWVMSRRNSGLPVSTVKIRLQAKVIASHLGIGNFKGSQSWCCRFMRRKGLSVRTKTTVGQSLPDDWEDKKSSFLKFVDNIVTEKNFAPSQIINMDEVPLTFDCPPNKTVHSKGDKTVSIRTTGNEKTSFTCVLSCTASGEKLKPLIIFKRKTMPKEDFPSGVIVRVNEKGWMCEQIMLDWLNEVWRKRPGAFFKPDGLLIMDSMRAHLLESVKSANTKLNTSLAIIPGGLTKKLHPLDIAVNRSFKSGMRSMWEDWMSDGLHTYTKMRKATFSEVAKLVEASWKAVKKTCAGFQEAGLLTGQSVLDDKIEIDDPETDEAESFLDNNF